MTSSGSVPWSLSKRGKHVMEILIINEAIPVMIDHVEGLLKLLNLVLVEHGEHITGGSLGPFLGSSSTPSSFTGRHLELVI